MNIVFLFYIITSLCLVASALYILITTPAKIINFYQKTQLLNELLQKQHDLISSISKKVNFIATQTAYIKMRTSDEETEINFDKEIERRRIQEREETLLPFIEDSLMTDNHRERVVRAIFDRVDKNRELTKLTKDKK